MEDIIRDIEEDNFYQAHVYDSLKDDLETKLYPDYSSFIRLSVVLRLFNIKTRNERTDKTFTKFQKLLHEMLR